MFSCKKSNSASTVREYQMPLRLFYAGTNK